MIDVTHTEPLDMPRMPDYEVIRCVGTGGFGDVWLARAKATQRFRAIKLVCRSRFPRETLYETEFAGLKKFEEISREHAGFIDILHVSRDDHNGCFCYVMELADDLQSGQFFDTAHYVPKTLANELARRQEVGTGTSHRLGPAECVQVALSLTAALAVLHENRLAHRDIKPSNIVFVRGVAKLADVGLVTEFKDEAPASTLIGTPHFMDPEVHGTPAGDLFAFGKVLYTMVTGRPVEEWPATPSEPVDCEDIDTYRELLHISQKACDPDRSRRYQTAEEIHRPLLLLRAGHSLRRLQRLERFVGVLKRVALVTIVVAALGLIIYQTVARRRQAVELRQHQVRTFLAHGTRALDEGDLVGALPWFAGALQQDRNNARAEPLHRIRLGMLLQQCPMIVQMWFADHPLNHAQFAGQENQVLLPTADHRWAIHDLTSGRLLHPPFGPSTGSDTVAISHSAGLALTSDLNPSNNVVRVWNYITGQEVATLKWEAGLHQVAISPDGRWAAAAATSAKAIVWDLTTRERLWTLEGHSAFILKLAFSPDGKHLVTAGADRAAIVWNLDTGSLLTRFTNHSSWIYSAAFSPDGTKVATAAFDRSVRVWEFATGREVLLPLRHGDGVHCVEFSADGSALVTAGLDFSVRVWSAHSGALLHQLRHHSKPLSAGFSPSGRYVITACFDGTERVWLLRPSDFAPEPTAACYSGDGQVFATASDHSVRIAESSSSRLRALIPLNGLRLLRVVPNQDGSRILTLTEAPPNSPSNSLQAILWDGKTGAHLGIPAILDRSGTNLVLSPDGRLAWTMAGDRDIIWDFLNDRVVLELQSSVQAAAFDDSGQYLAAAMGNDVQVWDLAGPEPRLRSTCPHSMWVGSVAWHPDGRHMVSACWDPSFSPAYAQVWDGITGTAVGVPLDHRDGVRFAAFSPDGKKVVTCGEDLVAVLWVWRAGRQLAPPMRHANHVVYAAFSPDSRRLATTSRGGAVRIWDADTGEPITQSLEHPHDVRWLQWINGDGGVLIQAPNSQSCLWNLKPDLRPVEKLVHIANLLSAQQIHSTGSAIAETKERLQQLWEEFRSDHPKDLSFRP